MNNLILWLVLLLAVCEWIAAGLRWVRVRQVTKPGTLLALLAWFTLTGRWEGPLVWFGLALVFSLAGDILLLLPYRYFLGGLAAFMIGHLFTIVGLNQQSPPGLPASALAVGATAVVVVPVLKRIQNGLVLTGRKRLRIPVFLYGVTIGLLLVSALWTLARAE